MILRPRPPWASTSNISSVILVRFLVVRVPVETTLNAVRCNLGHLISTACAVFESVTPKISSGGSYGYPSWGEVH